MTSVPYPGPTGADSSPVAATPNAAETSLVEAWTTLRKRKWVILGAALLGAVYGYYKAATQPRLYESVATIEIRSGSSNEYRLSTSGSGNQGLSYIPTQVALLKSDSLLLSVAKDLKLENDPVFMGPGGPRNLDDPLVRQSVINAMNGIVTITPVAKTDLIRISCSTSNAELSAEIANKLVTEYINHSFQSRADATERVTKFFSHQIDDLKQEVQLSQEQMIDLQKRLGVLGFDPSLNQVTQGLQDLNRAANEAEILRITAETRYRVLAAADRGSVDQPLTATGTSPAVTSLRSQLDTARANLAQLSVTLGPKNPQLVAAQDQVKTLTLELHEEQDRVISDARQAYVAAQAQENQTRAALNAAQENAYKLRDDVIAYTLRQRDFESNRTLYEGLLQRLRTAGVQAGLESTEIDTVDPAVPAIGPSLRPRSTLIVINTSLMLIVGMILAFVLESLDTGLHTVAEVEQVSGLPSLALIPRARRSHLDSSASTTAARNLGVLSSPKSQFAESFRALRTSLLLSLAGGEPRTILLTSATPSEGKTTISTNLACILAQRGVRVLLIDTDLRRPTVHHRLGLQGNVGLTSVLSGSTTLEQALQTVAEVPLLDVLVSGPVPPFPTEMLSSDAMGQLLDKCRGIYTHIVLDSPPLLSVTDSVVLAREADAIVLIVRHGKSSKNALRRARDLLVRSGARITGIAFNAVDLNSPEYYGYYGGYGYAGYGSSGMDGTAWESTGSVSSRPSNGRANDGGKA